MKQWLAERLQVLLPRLAVLGKDQEAEIQRLCEEEIASWRSRPTMKSLRSLNTPMIDARNAIKEQLEVTQDNSWLNPRTGEREHLARKYLNFSEQEWAAMHALTEDGRQQRLEGQQLLSDPDGIVNRGAELLRSQRWEEIAVGLAVTTGRRLTEILKTAVFHPMSTYTVQFEGQLKQKAELLAPYEIPTLVQADLVIEATSRLRTLLDCSALDNTEVERRYGPVLRSTADRHFKALVPTRAGREDNLFVHLLRAVYGTIATFYFAPPTINALVYLATIEGHYWLLRAESEEQRRNYLSTLHYDDYKIGDGHGNIDGRQGIRLGEPGVKVLSVFEEAVVAQQQKEERERMAKQHPEQTLPVVKASKTGYSMLRPKQATAQRVLQIMHERGQRHHDEVLALLADTYRLYEQMESMLAPLAETYSTSTPLETLKAVMDAEQRRDVAPTVNAHLQERWGTTLEEVDALFTQAAEQGEGQPVAYLREQLEKRTHYQQGPVKRQEHYQQLDFTTLSLEQLKAMRIPEATTERIRRAVAAIMRHNQEAQHDLDRWFIRAKEIKQLVGGRGELIAAYLQEHQAEIEQHHQQFGLNEKFNNKPFAITDKIYLS
jgi:hypothetical protein